MSWVKIKLSELTDIYSGYAFKSKDLTNEGGIPLIKIKNVHDRIVDKDAQSYLPKKLFLKKYDKYFLKRNDVLIAMTGQGSVGRIGKMMNYDKQYLVNQRVGIIRTYEDKLDSNFLYQYLATEKNETYYFNLAVGAGQPNLSTKDIGNLEIIIPESLHIQKCIASILSAYDDLIENNLKRIQLLEEAAQRIYKEWFIDFKFPNHENTSINHETGLPEGWKMKTMEDISEIIGGGTPSTKKNEYWENGNILWFSPTDLSKSKSLFLLNSSKKINDLGLKNSSAKLLPPNTILMSSRATIGLFGIIDKESSTNQGFINLVPKEDKYRYFLMFNLIRRKEELIANASGAIFKELSKTTFKKMSIIYPSNEVASSFNRIVENQFQTLKNLNTQNQTLKEARDLLLPRLMNRTIEV